VNRPRRYQRGCEHAASAIDALRPADLHLQHEPGAGWFTLCDACVRRAPGAAENADFAVCGACVVAWAETTDSDYVRRCQDPTPEFPGG
jgi:hypothetical protein